VGGKYVVSARPISASQCACYHELGARLLITLLAHLLLSAVAASRIIPRAGNCFQRKQRIAGKIRNDSRTLAKHRKEDLRLFFVLGLGYSLDPSPEDKFADKFNPQKPPASVSTVNHFQFWWRARASAS
jgi:hypothetical protein